MNFSKIIFIFAITLSVPLFSYAGGLIQCEVSPSPEQEIIGKWKFIGHIYKGKMIPPMNEKLIIIFQFLPDKTDILKWYRIDEDGFCERKGQYQYDGQYITDEITWINPKNAYECAKDPDMMLGRKTTSVLKRMGERLYLELPLGDDVITYIWEPFLKSNQ